MSKKKTLQIRMDEDLYNAFQELANEFADGNTSKYGRKLIKRVVRFNHDRSNR